MMEPVNPTLRANPGDRVTVLQITNVRPWTNIDIAMAKLGIKSGTPIGKGIQYEYHLPSNGEMTPISATGSRTSCGGHGGKFEIVERETYRDHTIQEFYHKKNGKTAWNLGF